MMSKIKEDGKLWPDKMYRVSERRCGNTDQDQPDPHVPIGSTPTIKTRRLTQFNEFIRGLHPKSSVVRSITFTHRLSAHFAPDSGPISLEGRLHSVACTAFVRHCPSFLNSALAFLFDIKLFQKLPTPAQSEISGPSNSCLEQSIVFKILNRPCLEPAGSSL